MGQSIGRAPARAALTSGDINDGIVTAAKVAADVATQAELDGLVDSAPGALDTLNELAAALNDDAAFSTTVTNSIALKAPIASPTFTGNFTSVGIDDNADALAMTIDSSENVGIGIVPDTWDSAQRALQIGLTGAVWSSLSGGIDSTYIGNNVYNNSGWKAITTGPASKFQLKDDTMWWQNAPSASADATLSFVDRMAILANGNVGIGVSPSVLLHCKGTNPELYLDRAATSDRAGISFMTAGAETNGAWAIRMNHSGTSATPDLSFHKFTGTDVQVMTLTNDGNVGIGDASPACALVIKGPAEIYENQTEVIRFERNAADIRYNSIYTQSSGTANDAWIQFRVHDGGGSPHTAQATVMTLTGAGRVGIGTAAPGAKLEFGAYDDAIWFGGGTYKLGGNWVESNGSYDIFLDSNNNDTGSAFQIHDNVTHAAGGGIDFTVKDGNVGIGIAAPTYPLEVIGGITARAANVIIDAQSAADQQMPGFRAGFQNHASLAGLFRYTTGDAQLWIDNEFTGNNGVYSNINFRNRANGGSSNLTRMTIHGSTGHVTKPYQPSFHACASPSKDGSGYIYGFGTVRTNTGGHYNNSTGRFTAPVAGNYLFTCGIWAVKGGTSLLEIEINQSGDFAAFHVANDAGNAGAYGSSGAVSVVLYLAVNDYASIKSEYTVQGSTPRNYFSGYLLG